MTCPRTGKWFSACRFEARYDVGAPDMSKLNALRVYDMNEVIRNSRPKTYIHDICVVCGKVVERKGAGHE